MGRRALVEPTAHLHIKLDPRLRAQMDAYLHDELMGRIPHAALKDFIEERLREFFTRKTLDMTDFGFVVQPLHGPEESVELVRGLLNDYKDSLEK